MHFLLSLGPRPSLHSQKKNGRKVVVFCECGEGLGPRLFSVRPRNEAIASYTYTFTITEVIATGAHELVK